jgi:hypothetical protein
MHRNEKMLEKSFAMSITSPILNFSKILKNSEIVCVKIESDQICLLEKYLLKNIKEIQYPIRLLIRKSGFCFV